MQNGKLLLIILLFLPIHTYCYFQQEVNYQIEVRLFTALNRLEGKEKLTYFNNSIDTLSVLYFHLYINKFKESLEKDENNFGYVEIISVTDSSDLELSYKIFGTIMQLTLNQPIVPGDSQLIHIRFNTILPRSTDGYGYYGYHYDVGNWYPVPAVYDQYGWHIDQHFNAEYYQEWGNYQVEITVPSGFIVGATGSLLNPEVLPNSVEYIDRRFQYQMWSDTSTVTYLFSAPLVHDFAWTADPEFAIRRIKSGNHTLLFFIPQYRLKDWEPQIEIARKCMQFFEDKIGSYPYPFLTVVDGYITAGGIEYPNLVIINDNISNPISLSATIIHEIAHQWFYGLIANNQTRYGWMDEGFATFFENLAFEYIYGEENYYVTSPQGFWGKYFGYSKNHRQNDLIIYLKYIRSGNEEQIDLPYDWFQNDYYTPYYQKMSLVISQLRYLLGDTDFWKGIKEYFNTWKFRHPYPQDLYNCFEKVSQKNLNWFFTQWLNTTWHCDYSVKQVRGNWKSQADSSYYLAKVTFEKKQPINMPLDFKLSLKDGNRYHYRIPVGDGENFLEPQTTQITPWSHYKNEKIVQLKLPDKISHVQIDPENKLLDINPFNNDSKLLPPIHWYWLHRQYLFPNTDGYTATIFPFIFYNQMDGFQFGLRTRGNFIYPDYQHRFRLLIGTRSFRPEVDFWFEHPVYHLSPKLHFITHLYNVTGRGGAGLWFQYVKNESPGQFSFIAGWQWQNLYELDYLPYPSKEGSISNFEVMLKKESWHSGYLPEGWEIFLNMESAFLGTDFGYQKWGFSGKLRFPLALSRKVTVGLLTGTVTGDPPLQKAFRLGGAEIYDLFYNPYLRAKGSLPSGWWENGNIFHPGGGNLRSLATSWTSIGNSILNGFLELDFGYPMNITKVYFPYISEISFSGYTTWSSLADQWGKFSQFYGEIGFTLRFNRMPFIFQYFDINQIYFDFPIWVNDTIDVNNIKFRWSIGLDIKDFY